MAKSDYFLSIVILLFVIVYANCAYTPLYRPTTQRSKTVQRISNISDSKHNDHYAQISMPSLSSSSSSVSSSSSSSSEYLDNDDFSEIFQNHPVKHRQESIKPNQKGDDKIVYPESESCIHGLCYNVHGYPKERIKKILNKIHIADDFFGTDDIVMPDIGNRFNTDETRLCETTVHTVYPEKANNTMQQERLIVNVEGHKQGITYEICKRTGECKYGDAFPQQYTSYCQQKYVHKRLMVLEDEKVVVDKFEVPSCCVCVLKKK